MAGLGGEHHRVDAQQFDGGVVTLLDREVEQHMGVGADGEPEVSRFDDTERNHLERSVPR